MYAKEIPVLENKYSTQSRGKKQQQQQKSQKNNPKAVRKTNEMKNLHLWMIKVEGLSNWSSKCLKTRNCKSIKK